MRSATLCRADRATTIDHGAQRLAAARIAGATPHHHDDRDGSEAEIFDIARTTTGRLVLAGRLWGSALFDAGDLLMPTDLRVTVPGERGSLLLAIDPAP